eukprot:Rhum_TRINITY_DN9444_c0_g1::Rhum_TRINITY_DN9444_c0_g1_i1::g.33322::m.33322
MERPFAYVALSGESSDGGGCINVSPTPDAAGDIGVSFADEAGRRLELGVNGVFTGAAQPEQVFAATVQPLCQRVLQGVPACNVTTIGGAGPQLFEDEGLGALAIRHILQALEPHSRPGSLRLGLSCFLSEPSRPTDLLKNVQQKVPPAMQWPHDAGLGAQKFVFCASLQSALRTIRAVLGAPSLEKLLPQLSYVLTLAVRSPASDAPPSRLTLLEMRAEHAGLFSSSLAAGGGGGGGAPQRSDMVSRALGGCRPSDCVVIGQCSADAPQLAARGDGGAAWRAARSVLEELVDVRSLPQRVGGGGGAATSPLRAYA